MKDMVAVKPYYSAGASSTAFYDLVTDADPSLSGDIDLYTELVGKGRRVLELGTGTGRVAIALAARGFEMVGLDIAPAMLAQAEAKRARLPPDIAARLSFVRGDLTAMALDGGFDAIFAPYFTLAHLQPATGWKRAFAGIARHLAPGGVVGLHLPIAEKMGAPPPPPDRPVAQHRIDDDRTLTIYVASQTMDARLGRMDLALDYVVTVASGAEEGRSRERFSYFTADPIPFAARAGLRPTRAPIALGDAGFVHVFGQG